MINFNNYSSSRISLTNMYNDHKVYIHSWFSDKYDIDLNECSDINKPNIIKYIMNNDINIHCICGKIKRWNRNRFLTTCGNKECTIKTRENTNIEKYGGTSPMSSLAVVNKIKDSWCKVDKEKVRNKKKQTCIEKYGGISPMASSDVQNKMKRTMIDKYGVDNYSKVSNFKDEINTTLKSKEEMRRHHQNQMIKLQQLLLDYLSTHHNAKNFIYNNKEVVKEYLSNEYSLEYVESLNVMQLRLLIQYYPYDIKCSCGKNKTWLRNKYNGTCGAPECIDKLRKSVTFERHGVTNYFQHESIIRMSKNDNINRTRFEIKNKQDLNKDFIETHFLNDKKVFDVLAFMKYFNYSNDCAPYRILGQLGVEFSKNKSSLVETQLKEFINDKIEAVHNSRDLISPYEIDIFIPSKNIGIEFNGMYWHSYGKKHACENQTNKLFQQKRHLEKTEAFEKLSENHQLFQIFENEWQDKQKQDIWKSILLSSLNKSPNIIFARKCSVRELSASEANDFILDNHIQGIRQASIKLGLIYNDEIISCMTFGKPLIDSTYEYELIRYCNKKYYSIPGAASKLLKYFEKTYKPKSIISYANRRWSKGKVYHKLGFEMTSISKPNKFIIKNSKIYNRIGFQKHKLEDKLENYDPNLSADDNLINNGYRLIWDCGNYTFTKTY